MIEHEQITKQQKPLPKPIIPPMAQLDTNMGRKALFGMFTDGVQ
jgi:hypothetical protein